MKVLFLNSFHSLISIHKLFLSKPRLDCDICHYLFASSLDKISNTLLMLKCEYVLLLT